MSAPRLSPAERAALIEQYSNTSMWCRAKSGATAPWKWIDLDPDGIRERAYAEGDAALAEIESERRRAKGLAAPRAKPQRDLATVQAELAIARQDLARTRAGQLDPRWVSERQRRAVLSVMSEDEYFAALDAYAAMHETESD